MKPIDDAEPVVEGPGADAPARAAAVSRRDPILTAHRGASHTSRQHEDFILIVGGPLPLIFEDGFESGDLSGWSRVVRTRG